MNELFTWSGGLTPLTVSIIRREGYAHADDHKLPEGYWEARVVMTGTNVLVRPEDLAPAFPVTVETGGAA
jgi:hypothetical protein